MLLNVEPGLIIWTVITFVLLLIVLRKVAWGPILIALEQREHTIRNSLEEAQRARQESENSWHSTSKCSLRLTERLDVSLNKGAKKHAQNSERVKIHVSTGDTVKVVRGDDKGHVGKVMRVYRKTGRVVVEGANFVKRHRKARTAEEQGGIVSFEAPIHSSNVMLPSSPRLAMQTDPFSC